MRISDDDEQHFLEEIDRCVDACRAVARNYAFNRGKLAAILANAEWLNTAPFPVRKHIDLVVGLLEDQLVMQTWMLLAKLNDDRDAYMPGQIAARTAKPRRPRRAGDGDQTLTRIARLYREGTMRWPTLLARKQGHLASDPEKVQRSHKRLLDLCYRIEKLAESDRFQYICITRHEGFAHSLKVSHARLAVGWDGSITKGELLAFGSEVMELALDFYSYWNRCRQSELAGLIDLSKRGDQDFWTHLKKAAGEASDDGAEAGQTL
jgi:hypothetical protein